jgi:hypothetical protein
MDEEKVTIHMTAKEYQEYVRAKTLDFRGYFICKDCGELTSPERPNTRVHALCWMCREEYL